MKINTAHAKFNAALRQVLSVSKEELVRREKQYRAERVNKPKPGPKPKNASASDHASDSSDSD